MSLRQIAKELGITPAYLSYMVNGKRPWRPDLYDRYRRLVNTSINSQPRSVNTDLLTGVRHRLQKTGGNDWVRTSDLALMKRPL